MWEGDNPSLWEKAGKENAIRAMEFNNFLTVTWYPDTKGGRCFDAELIRGGKFRFQAYDAQDALDWAKCFSRVGAESMAACRIQKVARGFRARRAFARKVAARNSAVDNVRRAVGHYEIVLEGLLRKREFTGMVSLWRQRYFELAPGRGELTYYESESRKRTAHSIPFYNLLRVARDPVRPVAAAYPPFTVTRSLSRLITLLAAPCLHRRAVDRSSSRCTA